MEIRILGCVASLGISIFFFHPACAAPHISKAVSVSGAMAYQDDTDSQQFWYIPTVATIGSIGSGPLKAFNVAYAGIGPLYYACSAGICRPLYGANVGATVNVDLSDTVRKQLTKEINNRFSISNPKLAPVRLSGVKATSLLIGTLSVANISQSMSGAFQFGQDVGFVAGSNGSNFGANLATTTVGVTGIVPNPLFQVEFTGNAEFAGDPWIVEATCNLTQAWSYVRASVSASATLGWFRIGNAQYESLTEELKRNGICTYKEVQGTLDVKNDMLPTLEMMRKLFEAMNAAASSGDGFFKFEPNPDPPEVSVKGATSYWPWSVSINAGYSSASFTQNITRTIRTEIQPRFSAVVGTTVTIAAKCTPQTKQFFTDLGDPSESCITPAKVATFNQIAAGLSNQLNARLSTLDSELEKGQITLDVYNQLRANAIADAGGTLHVQASPLAADGKMILISGPRP